MKVRIFGQRIPEDTQTFSLGGPEVQDLSDLTKLPALRELILVGVGATDFSVLRELKNLVLLYVERCEGFTDCTVLEPLIKLESLVLTECPISNVTSLQKLKRLRHLTLLGEKITSLKGLCKLPLLEELYLTCEAPTLEGLSDLPALRNLRLVNCPELQSLDGILGFFDLRLLYIGVSLFSQNKGKLRQLPDLRGLPDLNQVTLEDLAIQDISGLWGTEVETLEIRNSDVRDIDALPMMLNLKDLRIEQCELIRDFGPLEECKLRTLVLDRTKFTDQDLEYLQDMRDLEMLDLGGTEVTDLSPIAHLRNLKRLYLRDTPVISLAPIQRAIRKGLSILEYAPPTIQFMFGAFRLDEESLAVWGEHTTEKELETLKKFPNLRHLTIRDCPNLTDLFALEELQNLKTLSIIDCPNLTTLQSLRDLENIRHLTIAGCPKIESLEPIELHQLEHLVLAECKGIESLEPLRTMPLQTLFLMGTGVEFLDALEGKHCHVYGMGQCGEISRDFFKNDKVWVDEQWVAFNPSERE